MVDVRHRLTELPPADLTAIRRLEQPLSERRLRELRLEAELSDSGPDPLLYVPAGSSVLGHVKDLRLSILLLAQAYRAKVRMYALFRLENPLGVRGVTGGVGTGGVGARSEF